MMTNAKEVNKYFRAAKWNFNKAIELAKKSMVIGSVNFPSGPKAVKTRKAKTTPPATEGSE